MNGENGPLAIGIELPTQVVVNFVYDPVRLHLLPESGARCLLLYKPIFAFDDAQIAGLLNVPFKSYGKRLYNGPCAWALAFIIEQPLSGIVSSSDRSKLIRDVPPGLDLAATRPHAISVPKKASEAESKQQSSLKAQAWRVSNRITEDKKGG